MTIQINDVQQLVREHSSTSSSMPASPPEDGLALQKTMSSPYYALPLWRKTSIVFILAWTAMSSSFASTSLMSVTSEIAETLHTTSNDIVYSNAGVLFTMGCSSFIWGPISRLIGRKNSFIAAAFVYTAFTVGTSFSNNFGVFVALRLLSGIEGTHFHVSGQAQLADIFEPVQRGRATGCFLAGTAMGPALGPCIAGILVTFTSWRAILWLQAGMMGWGMLLSILFLPNIDRVVVSEARDDESRMKHILREFDSRAVFKPMIYPNISFTHLACGILSWCQYSLLTAPRHLINPRFHLDTPLVSGLFYLSPLFGFLVGTIAGGRYSDKTVIKWIKIRGLRLPQDRLNAGMIGFFFIIPVAFLIYGWCLEYKVGGLALPVIAAFFCAMGLLSAFASLNTYCAEVLPKQRPQIIAGKYCVQYTFSAAGCAAIVPLIDAIGIGLATTIGVILGLFAGMLTLVTAKYGLAMQLWVEGKLRNNIDEKGALG